MVGLREVGTYVPSLTWTPGECSSLIWDETDGKAGCLGALVPRGHPREVSSVQVHGSLKLGGDFWAADRDQGH